MEVSMYRLAMTGHLPITIISAYLHGGSDTVLDKNELNCFINIDGAVILAGDLNAKPSD